MGSYNIKNKKQIEHFNITTRLLINQALERGWDVEYTQAYPDENDSGIAHCTKDGKELFFDSSLTALTPICGFYAANNKYLTYGLFLKNKVPTPQTQVLTLDASDKQIESCLRDMERVVIKPLSTNHGVGITFDAKTVADVRRGIELSKLHSKSKFVLTQQQVSGKEYRFLVLEGKVIAVAHRRPPFVVGDGTRTVREFIDELNTNPLRGHGHKASLSKINMDDVIRNNEPGFIDSVPTVNQEVDLLKTSNLSRGGISQDFTDTASDNLKKIAVAAANSCFLGIAGVDIMTSDIENGDTANSYVIEVNVAPGLRMHQFPVEGKPRNVAKIIFKSIEKTARPIGKNIKHIGRSEHISLPEMFQYDIPSRIDTGATVCSVWASNIKETEAGLSFCLFDKQSELYTGQTIVIPEYGKRAVSSSMGHTQIRYEIKTLISIAGRRIRTTVTLANRSTQVYPILIGRNVLRGKFIVDVQRGNPSTEKERLNRNRLDEMVDNRSVI